MSPLVGGRRKRRLFRGRGLGTDVVAAMSAPMIAADGRPIGVVEGSLDLARLSNVVSQAVVLNCFRARVRMAGSGS